MISPKSWPFEQARALLERVRGKSTVVFQTGFGPSGAPHVGTFSEVVRTNMVRKAFEEITDRLVNTRLIVFSDDYDGFRRVPEGMPESMREFIGKPLTSVPDPFGEYPSFAHRNNAALIKFLEQIELENYEFKSATECYKSGVFDNTLSKVLANYEQIKNIMLPTLGETRRETYSPFMPISSAGNVLAEGVYKISPNGIYFNDENGDSQFTDVFGGDVKLQWKADWAMRWAAFGVDYEMHGKDLLDSAVQSSKICRAIGGNPPLTYFFELFLDDEGKKVSKSLGNGFSVDNWMRYSNRDSLTYYMFQSPRSAKSLGPSVIPRVTDEYLKGLMSYNSLDDAAKYDSPIWHVHGANPPHYDADVTYTLLLNLAEVSSATDGETLLNYLEQYKSLGDNRSFVATLVDGAVLYSREQMKEKVRRPPTEIEAKAFASLISVLETMEDGLDGESYQFQVYEIGKQSGIEPLRSWFQAIYEVYFGNSQGPRFGSFIAAYGRERTIKLLGSVL